MDATEKNRRISKSLARRAAEDSGLLASVAFGLYADTAVERAHAARTLRLVAARRPEALVPHAGDLIVSLDRRERRTRVDAVRALEALVAVVPEAIFDGAGDLAVSLHDPSSAFVRRGAFRALAMLVGECPDRAPVVWPWLDEALRVHHGDSAYPALLEAATGEALDVAPREARMRLARLAALDVADARPAVRRIAERLLELAAE